MTTATKAKPNEEERSEILEAFRDNDREAWERYHASKLVRRHAAQAALEAQFEAELAEAARQLAEDIEDDIFADTIRRSNDDVGGRVTRFHPGAIGGRAEVADHDRGATRGQKDRMCAADAAARAGHDHDAIGEVELCCHLSSLKWVER